MGLCLGSGLPPSVPSPRAGRGPGSVIPTFPWTLISQPGSHSSKGVPMLMRPVDILEVSFLRERESEQDRGEMRWTGGRGLSWGHLLCGCPQKIPVFLPPLSSTLHALRPKATSTHRGNTGSPAQCQSSPLATRSPVTGATAERHLQSKPQNKPGQRRAGLAAAHPSAVPKLGRGHSPPEASASGRSSEYRTGVTIEQAHFIPQTRHGSRATELLGRRRGQAQQRGASRTPRAVH